MFADKVAIMIQAGRGGDGKISFSKERYKGGPSGGDGGKGGDVIAEVDHNLNTLAHFRVAKLIKAQNGEVGGTNRKHGKSGDDAIIKVPPGTLIYEGERKLADLTANRQSQILAHGGLGGFGNAHFGSSTRQIPRLAELGEPGEEKTLALELKLVADVGLIGLPNAGKSTLLSVITNAKPEIADYPFTTLVPNLGVVDLDNQSFVVADIPGLIEGASKGKGLGDDFLRHIERTTVVLHLVDATRPNVAVDYKVVNQELKSYKIDLTNKPQLIVLTKIDALSSIELKNKITKLKKVTKNKIFPISAPAHQGLGTLLKAAQKESIQVLTKTTKVGRKEKKIIPIIDVASRPDLWTVEREKDGFIIKGGNIERFAIRTDFDNKDGKARFLDILYKLGISKELTNLQAKSGDIIRVANKEFRL